MTEIEQAVPTLLNPWYVIVCGLRYFDTMPELPFPVYFSVTHDTPEERAWRYDPAEATLFTNLQSAARVAEGNTRENVWITVIYDKAGLSKYQPKEKK